ncbi:hypothetical protein PoB_001008300 [Plakobranchus ocellatus]|uniref:Uncharacterized protein n=1 Tax=Plakobranchus ocellatus TaxID=259542 RepID=A0AAV3YMJ8_9GAST|nr:hypothetical protein PoB_001008300 [Plakobranchus ocellatus]
MTSTPGLDGFIFLEEGYRVSGHLSGQAAGGRARTRDKLQFQGQLRDPLCHHSANQVQESSTGYSIILIGMYLVV